MTRSSLLAALLLCAGPAAAARRAAVPSADELLGRALEPVASYNARGRVQAFPRGGKARMQALTVTAATGRRLRRVLSSSAKKPASLVLVSDGRTQSLLYVKRGLLWSGPESSDPRADAAALKASYNLTASTGSRVANRSTWRLDFRAKAGGALRRSWWVDRRTGVILRQERFRPDGTLARRERFSRFEEAEPGEGAFERPSGSAQPWVEPGGPSWRPAGFLPVERREAGASRVLGYGDGSASFTLLSAPPGAEPPLTGRNRRTLRLRSGEARLADTDDGVAMAWRCGGRACLVVGDLLEDELIRVADSLEAAK